VVANNLVKKCIKLTPDFGKAGTMGNFSVPQAAAVAEIVPPERRLEPEAFGSQPLIFPGFFTAEPPLLRNKACGRRSFRIAGR